MFAQTVFAGDKLMRRNAWGRSSERRYDEVQELRMNKSTYLDILFKSDCTWRILALEAPLDEVK